MNAERKTVTRTVQVRLQTSHAKNERVHAAIEEFHAVLDYMADILPSFPEYRWNNRDTGIYRRVVKEFPSEDRLIKASVARDAAAHAADAFASWRELGKPGERPRFDETKFIVLSAQNLTIESNAQGYGLRTSFIPYEPIWFHIDAGSFQERYLEKGFSSEGSFGDARLRFDSEGLLWADLTVKWEVSVAAPGSTSTTVGVTLGTGALFTAVANKSGRITAVDIEPGREFTHHREQLKEHIVKLERKNDRTGLQRARTEYHRYNDYIVERASRRISEFAAQHDAELIALEDRSANQWTPAASHDWPFGKLQQKITEKGIERGVPSEFVDPGDATITCRKCGAVDPNAKTGSTYSCSSCDYEVHAGVNAAANLVNAG